MYDSTRVRPPSASRRSRGGSTSTNTAVASGVPPRLAIPQEPPKVPRRPPSKGNKRETLADIARRIPVQLMRHYFNYPLRAAAEAMHISVTTLKRLCRRHGVKRWPHRQICGINRSLNDLEAQHETAKGEEMDSVADQLRQLHRRREVIIELAFESEDESGCKDFEDAPPAAHKRNNGRGSFTSSDGDSSASSSPSSSPSHSRSASFTSAPASPNAVDGSPPAGEAAAGDSWWKKHPGIDLPSAAAALAKTVSLSGTSGVDGACGSSSSSSSSSIAAATSASGSIGSGGGVKRPRQSSGGSPGPGKSKGPRKPKSSAMFGTIPPPRVTGGAAATDEGPFTAKHRRKNSDSSISSCSTSSVRAKKSAAKAVTSVRATISVPSRSLPSLGSAGGGGSDSSSSFADVPRGGDDASLAPPPLMIPGASLVSESSFASSSSSSSSSSSGISNDDDNTLFGLDSPTSTQQIDDLSVLGDLLFGPDEAAAAAAAAGARAQNLLAAQLHPGVFSHSASSQWGSQGPCVPLCPEGVFSQDAFLISASPFSAYENGFSAGLASANNWSSGLSWDSNGLGSSVGPL